MKNCGYPFINLVIQKYVGSSTETVAFQVYKILKIDHEFF